MRHPDCSSLCHPEEPCWLSSNGQCKATQPDLAQVGEVGVWGERQWQGLTTAERKALWNATKKPSEFAEMIEAKLREKNV